MEEKDTELTLEYIKAYQKSATSDEKQELMAKILDLNLGLVINIATSYKNRGLDFDDLLQEGYLALVKAVSGFDTTKNIRFSTYAHRVISQNLSRAIKEQAQNIRIPEYIASELNSVMDMEEKLSKKLKRNPTEQEVAQAMDIPLSKLRTLKTYAIEVISLDEEINNTSNLTLNEIVKSSDKDPEESSIITERKEMVNMSIDLLSQREKEIVTAFFGLDDGNPVDAKELAHRYQVSPERIRQIVSHAVRFIRSEVTDDEK